MNMLSDLSFFLFPENLLSWLALFVFLLVFIVSSKFYFGIVNKMDSDLIGFSVDEKNINLLREKEQQLLLFSKETDKIISLFVIVNNLILIAGIGFTFIGIGISLRYAGNLMSNQDFNITLSILDRVLGLVGYKFQTSVYGFITYILINLLFVKKLYNIKGEIDYEIKRLEKIIHDSQMKNLLDSLVDMPRVIKGFEDIAKGFSSFMEAYKTKSLEVLTNFNQRMEESASKLGSIKDDINQFLIIANKGLDDILTGFEKSVNNIVKLSEENSKKLKTSLERIDETLKDINNDINQNLNNMKEANAQSISELNEKIENMLNNIGNSINQKLADISGGFNNSISEIYKLSEKSFQKIDETLGKIDETLERNLGDNMKFVKTLDERLSEKLDKVNESISENLQKISGDIDKSNRTIFEENRTLLEDKYGNLKELLKSIHESLIDINNNIKIIDLKNTSEKESNKGDLN